MTVAAQDRTADASEKRRSDIIRRMPPAGAAVEIRRGKDLTWRIGDGRGHDHDLGEVLVAAAGDPDFDESAHVCAWQLLLRVNYTAAAVELLREQLHDGARQLIDLGLQRLQPLFAMLASRHPTLIAPLFPEIVDVQALALCGHHGIRPALRELDGWQKYRRQQGAFACECLALLGVDVPAQPLLEALKVERDIDVRNLLNDAIEAIDELNADPLRRPSTPAASAAEHAAAPRRRARTRPRASASVRRTAGTRRRARS